MIRFFAITIFILLVNSFTSFAQSPMEILRQRQEKYEEVQKEYNEGLVDTSKRFFFNSYNDYVSGKHVEGIKYVGQRKIVIGTESVLVSENNDYTSRKVKDLNYWGFIDEWGQLERIYNKNCYYVLDTGKICLYLKAIDVEMTTDKNGNYSFNWLSPNSAGYKDYISEGLNGTIEDFSDSKFQRLTADHPEIYDQFKNEKIDSREKDSRGLKTFRNKKYIHMYNKK